MAEKIAHPENKRNIIVGQRLNPGDEIKVGDVYSASNGVWRGAPLDAVGGTVPNESIVWVRPNKAPYV